MSPLISVIVPVYNVSNYLEKCINSIFNQTYANYELILIDDGSTDGSGELCDDLSSEDPRVVCIHKNNGGLSSARNAGLNICKGDYITFVDSDDMISPNALTIMVDCALKTRSDIVATSKFISFYENDLFPVPSTIQRERSLDAETALQEIICRDTRWEAWGHLFQASLWGTKRFPEGKLYEDLATIPYILASAEKTTILDCPIYYYRQRPGSIMRQSESRVSLDLCTITNELISYFSENISGIGQANICSGILMELCSRMDLAERNAQNNMDFIKAARAILKANANYILKSDYYNIKQKTYYFLESFGFHNFIQLIHNR